jgi:hypothetical protein
LSKYSPVAESYCIPANLNRSPLLGLLSLSTFPKLSYDRWSITVPDVLAMSRTVPSLSVRYQAGVPPALVRAKISSTAGP